MTGRSTSPAVRMWSVVGPTRKRPRTRFLAVVALALVVGLPASCIALGGPSWTEMEQLRDSIGSVPRYRHDDSKSFRAHGNWAPTVQSSYVPRSDDLRVGCRELGSILADRWQLRIDAPDEYSECSFVGRALGYFVVVSYSPRDGSRGEVVVRVSTKEWGRAEGDVARAS